MMSETLAEYSALMVMQHKYGDDNMHKFLQPSSIAICAAAPVRSAERPLALVQQEAYVWYQKGGQIMYALADYIGEDKSTWRSTTS